jgi:hypothetical protein
MLVRPQRGHAEKIERAVKALWADGRPPPGLRPGHRDKAIIDWCKADYGDDLPSPRAIGRWLESCTCKAPESPESPKDRDSEAA